jgi:hypothetical protein
MDSFVWYRILINEELSRVTTIKVKEGEYIDSIIDGIKLKESPAFDSVPASSIELFESIESAEPLHASTPWNANLTWGKPETPLIVRVQPSAIAPGNNSEGKCFWCLFTNCNYVSRSNSSLLLMKTMYLLH